VTYAFPLDVRYATKAYLAPVLVERGRRLRSDGGHVTRSGGLRSDNGHATRSMGYCAE